MLAEWTPARAIVASVGGFSAPTPALAWGSGPSQACLSSDTQPSQVLGFFFLLAL